MRNDDLDTKWREGKEKCNKNAIFVNSYKTMLWSWFDIGWITCNELVLVLQSEKKSSHFTFGKKK